MTASGPQLRIPVTGRPSHVRPAWAASCCQACSVRRYLPGRLHQPRNRIHPQSSRCRDLPGQRWKWPAAWPRWPVRPPRVWEAWSRWSLPDGAAATGTGRWPANRALARLDLATALAQLGEPEESSHTALEALAIFSERPVDSVMRRAGDLEAVLDVEQYRQLPAVRQFREQLHTTRTEAALT
jgi:hypothetical protein